MTITVKELREILEGCNDDAEIIIQVEQIRDGVFDNQIFQSNDGKQVIFDLNYGIES